MARRVAGPAILTRAEAAQALGIHPSTVARWAASGALPSLRTPSGERRYYRCDVEAFLNRSGVAGETPSKPVCKPTEAELADQHCPFDRSKLAILSLPTSSCEDHGCCRARRARSAG